ncbi:MAG: hypothetical protein AAGA48_02590 [Myxococcota bacterium]
MLWAELRQRHATIVVLLLCAVVVVLHQAARAGWFIDDAAICFAYARNLVAGEGVVPWPGGERIEGFSDPTWVLLLAVFQAVGLDGFSVAKPLGMAFGIAALVPSWRLAKAALPDHAGDGALVAPIVLALNPQFAIWCASGLENGLFCFLLAVLLDRVVQESGPRGGLPGAALAGLLLVWTRPEGLAYTAMAGTWLAVFGWQQGRGLAPALRFAAIVLLPSVVLELGRLAYFAWPLPNPFYAKIASRGVVPLDWTSRGWTQVQEWSTRLWHLYYVPFYVLGLTGRPTRPSARIGLGLTGVVLLMLLWPWPSNLQGLTGLPSLPGLPATAPEAFLVFRLLAIVALWLGLPLLGLKTPGARATVLCGHAVAIGLLFSIWANGDWMGAYRFLSLIAVPLAVLVAVGLTRALDALPRTANRWSDSTFLVASVLVGAWMVPGLHQTFDHLRFNTNETTTSVKQRVDHTRNALRTAFWTEPVTTIDVDQGAHLWWAPDYRSIDMGMLVDIPMARHWYQQRSFIEEYVYEEHQPTFAFVSGWWALHSGLRTYPAFERGDYIALPPYTDIRTGRPFGDVFVHRSVVVAPQGEVPLREVADGVALGPVQMGPWVPGQPGYLEVPLQLTEPPPSVTLTLHQGDREITRWKRPLGYGWLAPEDVRADEVFRNRWALDVPSELQAGTSYTLQLEIADQAVGLKPLVVPVTKVAPSIQATRQHLRDHAQAMQCHSAEVAFVWIERQRPTDWAWHASRPGRAEDRGTLAACWAQLAASHWPSDRAAAIEALSKAHRWDHHHPTLRRIGGPIGEALWRDGKAARAEEDWEHAYQHFRSVLQFQPWRAWARRYAEEARDHRLGLVNDVRIGRGGDDDRRRAESER